MKNKLLTIFASVMLLLVVVVAVAPQPAEASCVPLPGFGFSVSSCAADIGNIAQGFFGLILTFTGVILNISIKLTLNIREIYKSTPAIDNVWLLIRNLSSIFIIFVLLYASISTILDVGKTNIKELVGKIILAGVLINFSLFFTKVAIDASNLVSMQFYRAITPGYNLEQGIGTVKGAFTDGGISDIFMNSLKIQRVYDPQTSGFQGTKDEGKILASIIIGTYGGVILMLFASISFLGAAVAFAIRTGMLLLLMAFSPIYFAGMIFPKIKSEVSDYWLKTLMSQLLFMPIYLLLMYVALRFISDSGFMSFLQTKEGVTSGSVVLKQVGVVIQYFIAILFINVPLLAAIKFGAVGTGFATDLTKGLKDKLYKQPGQIGAAAWRNTGGLAASKVADSNFAKSAASRFAPAAGALRGLKGVAKSYDEENKKKGEERAKFGESLGYNKKHVSYLENTIKNTKDEIDKQDLIINEPGRSAIDVKAAKDQKRTYQQAIRRMEGKISDTKRERQTAYAGRLDPREVDPATGKLKPMSLGQRIMRRGYVSQDEKIGSAQIHIKNTEAELEQLKKLLEDKKKEQSTIKEDIKRIDNKEKDVGIGNLNPDQEKKRKELKADLFELLEGVLDPVTGEKEGGIVKINKEINNKELEIKKYKNLT